MRRDEERDVRERSAGGAEAVERVGDGARPVLRRRRPAHHRDADEEDERRDGHRAEGDARAADLELALLVEREDGERQPVPERADGDDGRRPRVSLLAGIRDGDDGRDAKILRAQRRPCSW